MKYEIRFTNQFKKDIKSAEKQGKKLNMENNASIMLETMEKRSSCRKYTGEYVPDEIVEKIVRAGTYAATGMNRQSPVILAISNKELRDKLSKLNAAVMGSSNDPFYGAPQVLVVLANKDMPTYIYDGSLVMGNMMNAAEALGVSCCWIHRAKEVFDSAEGKKILEDSGITGNYEGIGNLIIGYDAGGKREKSPRKENYAYFIK